jgi:transposase
MAKEMTLSAVAEIPKIALSTLSDILHRCVQRERKDHEIGTLTSLGIDKIPYPKGKKFATIVYDLERSKVVWIGKDKGKGRETIDHFFDKVLGKEKSSNVKTASCDMAQAYIGAIEQYCKNSKLALDRFHVVKAINDAVDEVREEAWSGLSKDERKAIKVLHWLLYRNFTTRNKSDTKTLNDLKKGNNKIYRAWVLKEKSTDWFS